jgi:hypothetical protein
LLLAELLATVGYYPFLLDSFAKSVSHTMEDASASYFVIDGKKDRWNHTSDGSLGMVCAREDFNVGSVTHESNPTSCVH